MGLSFSLAMVELMVHKKKSENIIIYDRNTNDNNTSKINNKSNISHYKKDKVIKKS